MYLDSVIGTKVCPKEPVPPVIRMDALVSMCVTFLILLRHGCRLLYVVLIAANALDASTQLHDLRTIFEGGDTMRDDEQGDILTKTFNGLHDKLFCFIIQCAGGFVKYYNIIMFVEGAGDPDALVAG